MAKTPSKLRNISSRELFYDSFASSWPSKINSWESQIRLHQVFTVLLAHHDIKGKKFLDVGAGLGFFSCEAAKRGADVTAVDIGNSLLKALHRKCPARTVLADALDLPFKPNSFDYVLLTEVIEHTPNPLKAIDEAIRVLKKDGYLVLTSPNKIWRSIFIFLTWLGVRPYRGLENWLSYNQARSQLLKNNAQIACEIGFHPLINVSKFPINRFLINYGFLAIKK